MIQEKIIGTKTLEQLLSECAAPEGGDDPGQTVGELCASLGVGERTARVRLRTLMEAGKLVVGRARRMNLSGVATRVPVYRLADARRRK